MTAGERLATVSTTIVVPTTTIVVPTQLRAAIGLC